MNTIYSHKYLHNVTMTKKVGNCRCRNYSFNENIILFLRDSLKKLNKHLNTPL